MQTTDQEIMDHRFVRRLADMREYSIDTHKIATPLELCREMIQSLMRNSVPLVSKSYLVISNLEFIYILKRRLPTMDNVWYATPDLEDMGAAACAMGVKPEHILIFKNGTADIKTEMTFDVVISNPPYNPSDLWKKFVELQISLLKNDGYMITVHPSSWREHSKFEKIFELLKQNIIELHINDYDFFKDVTEGLKTDWYIYQPNYHGPQKLFCKNSQGEIADLKNSERILRISPNSIPFSILNKITTNKDNGIKLLGRNGYHPLYKKNIINGKYKQCGVEGNGTGWCEDKFGLTADPSEHQFVDKVVISYVGKPRARFFPGKDEVGVIRAHCWLTDNQSLPLLLNSKMFWKLYLIISDPDGKKQREFPAWLLKQLNFDGLTATIEEELYKHYKLSEEEINWINE